VSAAVTGKNPGMDEQVDLTRYEQNDPDYTTEEEFVDRARGRLDEALRKVAETEDRMARNAGHDREDGEADAAPPS
jgi:hypothetical protein